MGILTGSTLLIPSCTFDQKTITRSMNNLEITTDQEALMKALVDAILPQTDIPGGLELGIDGFVWVMADDCLSESSQEQFVIGSRNFAEEYRRVNKTDFESENQQTLVKGLEKMNNSTAPEKESASARHFLQITKEFCIMGFTRSEYFMTELMPYKLVPGGYGPCETIDPSKPINRNA